jgi:hypothetical protein
MVTHLFCSSNVEGFAPLHYAAGEGNLEISQYLVEACDSDPVAPDNLGTRPFVDPSWSQPVSS